MSKRRNPPLSSGSKSRRNVRIAVRIADSAHAARVVEHEAAVLRDEEDVVDREHPSNHKLIPSISEDGGDEDREAVWKVRDPRKPAPSAAARKDVVYEFDPLETRCAESVRRAEARVPSNRRQGERG